MHESSSTSSSPAGHKVLITESTLGPSPSCYPFTAILISYRRAILDHLILFKILLPRVNPLRANPYVFAGGHYLHLPRRVLRDGKWHTLSLKDQYAHLNAAWSDNRV